MINKEEMEGQVEKEKSTTNLIQPPLQEEADIVLSRNSNIEVINPKVGTNGNLKEIIIDVLEKIKEYRNETREPDKRILLEAYGLALSISKEIKDDGTKEKIEKEIIKCLETFAWENLRLAKDIELSNLPANRKSYEAAFENIRLRYKDSDFVDVEKSLMGIDFSFKEVITDIFDYLHGILGGPPPNSSYAMVSIGSLATRMTTPYSDIEFLILVDRYSDENRNYFTNFADLFELLMISFGESPIYKAESLLAGFKNYIKYSRKGIRLDERKKPQHINRLYGLIITPEELLEKLPMKIIHESGNHLTSALLTPGFLTGSEKLYDKFETLLQKVLVTDEYLSCLRRLLQEDLRASNGFQKELQNSFWRKEYTKKIGVKNILLHAMHPARTLAIFLRSAGKNIELKSNFFDVIGELRNGNYINQEQYQSLNDLVLQFFELRLEQQSKNQSAVAEIAIKDLQEKFDVIDITQQLQGINNTFKDLLDYRKVIKHSAKVINFTRSLSDKSLEFQPPYTNPNFVERKGLWDKMTMYLENKERQILILAVKGTGGMGKTEMAAYYYLNPPRPYLLRAWFRVENREQLYTQYTALIKEAKGIEYPKEMPIEKQAKEVKKWLEEQKDCLLVYDNVEGAEELEGLLPRVGKHHILITSRSSVDWPGYQMLDVDVMEEGEANELIIKITGSEEGEEKLKKLVKTLGCLPLALAQAGAYMVARFKTIDDYLIAYEQSQAELLTVKTKQAPKHTAKDDSDKYDPVWVTFDMNFKALKQECPAALNTLKQSSWLASSSIPEILLLNMAESKDGAKPKTLIWDEVKEYIGKYSLMRIKKEQHALDIHQLLQDILRSKQTEEEQMAIFKHVSKCLDDAFESLNDKSLDYKNFLTHAEKLYQHGQKVAELAKKYGDEDADFLLIKPDCLHNVYFDLKLAEKQLAYSMQKKQIYENKYGQNHPEMASLLGYIGIAYRQLGKINEAKSYLEETLKIQEGRFGKEHFEISNTLNNLGIVYAQLGKIDESKNYLEEALEMQEKRFGKEHFETSNTLNNLGIAYAQLGKLKEAKKYLEKALKIQENRFRNDHFETAAALGNLGDVCRQLGELNEAKKYLEEALRIEEAYYGLNHFETANTLNSLGIVYEQLGELNEAKNYYEKALKFKYGYFGKDHFETAAALGNLGDVCRQLGELNEAKNYLEEALRIEEAHYGLNHFEVAKALVNAGNVYRQLGKIDEAKNYCEKALKIQEEHYGEDHSEITNTLATLGNVYSQLHELDKAKNYLERALKIHEKHFKNGHRVGVPILCGLGSVCMQLMNLVEAKKYCEQALSIQEAYCGQEYFETSKILNALGHICLKSDQLVEAREYFKRALKNGEMHYGSKDNAEGQQHLVDIEIKLSQIYFSNGDSENYKKSLEELTKLTPGSFIVYQNLGCCYNAEGNYEQANINLEKACYLNPSSSTYCEYGHFLMQRKEWNKAIIQLEKSIDSEDDGQLIYGLFEKNIVDRLLREIIDKCKDHAITVEAKLLARYLLVKCYHEIHDEENTHVRMEEFKKLANNAKDQFLMASLSQELQQYFNNSGSALQPNSGQIVNNPLLFTSDPQPQQSRTEPLKDKAKACCNLKCIVM